MGSLAASATTSIAPPAAALRLFSDERLARFAASGSEAAFSVIFERHHEALHRYCHSIVGNGHDAADALQNTMVKALRALPGETREINLKPWLYRIAHNESISLLRARRPDSDLETATHVGDLAAETVVESRERLRDLTADLAQLTEQQRGALLMRELGGLPFADVAGALAVSSAAAKQSVYEARCALQAMQEGRAMDCDLVRRALSDGDKRTLRAMKMRGHLRACAGCRDFEMALHHRPAQLAALAPPLPLALAATMLQNILGGAGHGGGGLAAGLAAGAGAGQGGGILTAVLGAGAKAGGALSLGAAKVAAAVVVATSVAGAAVVYVAPQLRTTWTAPTAHTRDAAGHVPSAASLATQGATTPAGRAAPGSAATSTPAATKTAVNARALAPQTHKRVTTATPSGASQRHQQPTTAAGQAAAHANPAASGATQATRRPTPAAASKPTAATTRPTTTRTPSTAAKAPSAATSRPVTTAPAAVRPTAPSTSSTTTPAAPTGAQPAAPAPSTPDVPAAGTVTPPRGR